MIIIQRMGILHLFIVERIKILVIDSNIMSYLKEYIVYDGMSIIHYLII